MSGETMTQSLRDALDEIRYAITCPVSGIPEAECLLPLLENAYVALQAAPQQEPDGYLYRYHCPLSDSVHTELTNRYWNGNYAFRVDPYWLTPPASATVEAATIERMRAALEFYASDDNYLVPLSYKACGCVAKWQTMPVIVDDGERARAALASQPAQSQEKAQAGETPRTEVLAKLGEAAEAAGVDLDPIKGPYGRIDDLERALQAANERAEQLNEELASVLHDWNEMVKAIGSPTNGGAVGYAKQLRAQLAAQQADADLAALFEQEMRRIAPNMERVDISTPLDLVPAFAAALQAGSEG